jgi:hypothetical protein
MAITVCHGAGDSFSETNFFSSCEKLKSPSLPHSYGKDQTDIVNDKESLQTASATYV